VQVLTRYLTELWPIAASPQVMAAGPEQFVMAGQKLLKLMGVEDADKYLRMPDPMQMLAMQMAAQGGMLNGGQPGGVPAPQGGGGA
jgi:hypothetical protein